MLHIGNRLQPLEPEVIACIQDLYAKGFTIRQLARIFNISKTRVNRIVSQNDRTAWLERCLREYGIETNVLTRALTN